MPQIILLAGPNGAGKTTFANEYLTSERNTFVFINADEIAREMGTPPGDSSIDRIAAREMLTQFDAAVSDRKDFVVETTLASLMYAQKIQIWRQQGYTVSLIYLRLPNVDASMQRVLRRVEAGGHGIPEQIIRRRFPKSAEYLERIYKPIVDEWYIWDSLEQEFRLAESG